MDVLRKSSYRLLKYRNTNLRGEKSSPHRAVFLRKRVLRLLTQHRYHSMLAVAALVVFIELIEHLLLRNYSLRTHQIFDVGLYALLLAPLAWLALTELASIENERSQAAEQAAANEADRQQIAQDLHDTLAQNIGYLRLKLDQLTSDDSVREISLLLQELERMRLTADEAYAQVRHTLDELAPAQNVDLVTSVNRQAQAICERAALKLRTSQIGTPYSLDGAVRQQILFIAREALHNIEKHACARQVHLQFLWLEGELIMKITDDGTGFNPLSVPLEGHYGLWIMQQRAGDLGGTLKVTPSDEKGTEVTLWVPRSPFLHHLIDTTRRPEQLPER